MTGHNGGWLHSLTIHIEDLGKGHGLSGTETAVEMYKKVTKTE